MTSPIAGGVDCDLHPAVPHLTSLLPYLNDYWRDQVTTRGMIDLVSQSYPANSPLTVAAGLAAGSGQAGLDLARCGAGAGSVRHQLGICNCLYGVQLLFSEDMAAGFCRAVNDWLAHEWLDKEPRLRGSIVVPMQNPREWRWTRSSAAPPTRASSRCCCW